MAKKQIKVGNILNNFEKKQQNKKIPVLRSGDTVRVYAKIKEGDKERIQIFEGMVTRSTKGNNRAAITVRKVSFGVGVERVFPLYSSSIDKIERVSQGKVRRARLYYLRKRKGKASRIEAELSENETSYMESLSPIASGPEISKKDKDDEKKTAPVEATNALKG